MNQYYKRLSRSNAFQDAMALDARAVAAQLGGNVAGRDAVLAPGPGHSRADRSLSIKIDPGARDGFVLHSFAGDSVAACRDHVRARLGIDRWAPRPPAAPPQPRHDAVAPG